MHASVHPLIINDGSPQVGQQRRASAPNTRRSSQVLPSSLLSRNKSTKSLKQRRQSSGALPSTSTVCHTQKARKCIGEYYVGKTLGKGASGRVKLGVHKYTGEQVAIKIISKSHLAANPAIEKAVRREIAIMKLIDHPNVMSLIDVIDDDNSPDLHLILEYVEGGELFEYLVSKGRLSENEARHHFQHIIMGLDYCHHHLICHRDLKPENLLLDRQNNIKIADFGMASLQPTGSMLETSCGSPHYASPEIVAGMPYNGSASDIWSCGVILYALLTGHLPFDDDNIRQLLKKVKAGKYVMPDNISRSAQDLIRRILVVDPSKRLTMKQIMSHPWFREIPVNMAKFPMPPSPSEIGRPIDDPSEIDDRLVETIKFLWGESNNDSVVNALISDEPNMQKVVYVLLQQHAERYWQVDHCNDDDDFLEEGDIHYQDVRFAAGTSSRSRHSLAHRSERDRRCMSMADQRRGSVPTRPIAPWLPDTQAPRRYSAVSMRVKAAPDFLHHHKTSPPPLPTHGHPLSPTPLHPSAGTEDDERIKKSQTFYERFVRGVLSSSARRQSRDRSQLPSPPPEPSYSASPSPPASSLTETIRRRNPFIKSNNSNTNDAQQQPSQLASKTPVLPPKSSLRGSILQRNKIDPGAEAMNTKRLSIRVPGSEAFAMEPKKFGMFSTLTGANRRSQQQQRKQIDLAAFGQCDQQGHDALPAPPTLSDNSTLSSSSSSSSSSNHSDHKQKSINPQYGMMSPQLLTPPPSATRRGSQASFNSFDRRYSEQRPATPSLLSNSSTLTTSVSNNNNDSGAGGKSLWISNLFFFKQPKVCTITVYDANLSNVLRMLNDALNKAADEVRLYEKSDKAGGTRYKVEIKQKSQRTSKVRQVKCRMDFHPPSVDQIYTRIHFTQQQGDALFLTSIAKQVQEYINQDTVIQTMTKTAAATAEMVAF
ncbi:hypothetical protein BX666DRAFT_2161655 [Dichotomocladium elegans]|nr:hypothetical protein BX666DRAFT_2161655 [Dichotomocladium elegans]